jgi:hypothetical protein
MYSAEGLVSRTRPPPVVLTVRRPSCRDGAQPSAVGRAVIGGPIATSNDLQSPHGASQSPGVNK